MQIWAHFWRFPPFGGRAKNRALRSNSSTFPAGKSAVFPLQSLARIKTAEAVLILRSFALRNSWASFGGVWGSTPNSENQNARRFGSPCAGGSLRLPPWEFRFAKLQGRLPQAVLILRAFPHRNNCSKNRLPLSVYAGGIPAACNSALRYAIARLRC
jgi:hypothetical protein